jgi:hypothetical protein
MDLDDMMKGKNCMWMILLLFVIFHFDMIMSWLGMDKDC